MARGSSKDVLAEIEASSKRGGKRGKAEEAPAPRKVGRRGGDVIAEIEASNRRAPKTARITTRYAKEPDPTTGEFKKLRFGICQGCGFRQQVGVRNTINRHKIDGEVCPGTSQPPASKVTTGKKPMKKGKPAIKEVRGKHGTLRYLDTPDSRAAAKTALRGKGSTKAGTLARGNSGIVGRLRDDLAGLEDEVEKVVRKGTEKIINDIRNLPVTCTKNE